MKKRLFDFSVPTALITVAAYALLLTLFANTYFMAQKKAIFGILFLAFVASFLFVFGYFVLLAAHLEKDGIHQGRKFIARSDIQCRTAYDLRFREGVIIIRRLSVDYTELNVKQKKKQTIRVQATAANLRKLGAYLGRTLEMPQKPPRRRFGKKGTKQ